LFAFIEGTSIYQLLNYDSEQSVFSSKKGSKEVFYLLSLGMIFFIFPAFGLIVTASLFLVEQKKGAKA